MFVFGILEYGRYILVLHVTTNAAREGARHAVVRSNAPEASNYTVHPVGPLPGEGTYGPGRTVYKVPFVETYTKDRMGGLNGTIVSFTVRVFPCDTAQLYDSPCVVAPKLNSTSWSNASFSERIAVKIVGEYKPILPSFLFMSDSVPISTVALMGSEG